MVFHGVSGCPKDTVLALHRLSLPEMELSADVKQFSPREQFSQAVKAAKLARAYCQSVEPDFLTAENAENAEKK